MKYTFKQFLSERATKPEYLSGIAYELKALKPELWENDLSISEIALKLKKALSKYLIRFEESYSSADSEYGTVGLNGAEISGSGWITVNYTSELEDVLNGEHQVYYEDFTRLLGALLGHELKHREQLLKSTKNFDNAPDTEDKVKYLSDHREIEAYAIQASLELLSQLDVNEILEKLKTEKGLSNLSLYSEGIKWYLFTFDSGSAVLKKFLKKVYEVLTEPDEE